MRCPTCTDQTLVISERQGVEIDDCPTCRGVWLDRGELDKLIDKALAAETPRAMAHATTPDAAAAGDARPRATDAGTTSQRSPPRLGRRR